MGRPINKRAFEHTEASQGIKIISKLPGLAATEALAINQKGTKRYTVTIGNTSGIITLVDKTDPTTLLDNEGCIVVSDTEGNRYPVTKITQHKLVAATPSGLITPTWVLSETNSSGIGVIDNSGNIIPDVDPETAPTVTFDTALNPAFVKSDGFIYVGTGISGNSAYKVVKTNFIEIALSSHRRGQWAPGRTIDQSTYTIQLDTNVRDFNVTWSIGLTDKPNQKITDLYDVTMITHMEANGTKNYDTAIHWRLTWTDLIPGYAFIPYYQDVAQEYPIVDSGSNPDKTCLQNSFRHFWYREAIIPPVDPAAVRITGTFVTELNAVNKESGLEIKNEITSVVLPN